MNRVQMVIDSSDKVYMGELHAPTRGGAMLIMPWAKIVKKVNNGWIGFESVETFREWCGGK